MENKGKYRIDIYMEYLLYIFMKLTTLITKKTYFQRSGNKSEDNSTNQQFIQHRPFFVAEILYCQRFVGTSYSPLFITRRCQRMSAISA